VEVDYLKQQFDAFVIEAQNPRGFTSQGLTIAASWLMQNNYELEKALEWITLATSPSFPGDPASFSALSTRAFLLDKLKRPGEFEMAIKAALPHGNVAQLQQLGRQLLAMKRPMAAKEVFEFNYKEHPDQFITLSGMARNWSAQGDFKKALEFANRALPLAPNEPSKQAVQGMIDKLKEGKDVN
jgi:tetratricopeptide (TPR) repeat protein